MSSFVLIALAVVVGSGLLVALVVGIVVAVSLPRRNQPGWRPSGWPTAPGSMPPTAGTWNAQLLGSGVIGALGGTLGSTFGTFELDRGTLRFVADGAVTPAWSVPCTELVVTRRNAFAPDGADLRLAGPMGELRCTVSTERINRFTRNAFKDLRERGYAAQFVSALHAHGARVLR